MTDDHRADRSLIAVLSLGVMTMLAASLGAMLFIPVPEQNRESVSLLIGSVISLASAVVAYFFGRSDGERTKDKTIGAMAATMQAGSETSSGTPIASSNEVKPDDIS